MAQHHRTIESYHPDRPSDPYLTDIHQCSVSDFVTVEGGCFVDDSYKIAAAILEMYRYRGYSINELLEMLENQINEWDKNEDNS